jgi:hypothetical protein
MRVSSPRVGTHRLVATSATSVAQRLLESRRMQDSPITGLVLLDA